MFAESVSMHLLLSISGDTSVGRLCLALLDPVKDATRLILLKSSAVLQESANYYDCWAASYILDFL
jgi:hypothetical protein